MRPQYSVHKELQSFKNTSHKAAMEGPGLREPSPAAEVTQLSLQSEGIWKAVGSQLANSQYTSPS